MTNLAYFPVVEDSEELTDVISRAGWFLTFSAIEKIYVFVSDPALARAPWEVAPGMDAAIADRFDALRDRIVFVTARQESDLVPVIEEVSDLLVFKQGSIPSWLPAETAAAWRAAKRVHEVDPAAIRQEGGNYIDVGFQLMPSKGEVISEARTRFRQVTERLGKYENAVVVATGPSAQRYSEFDFADTLGIVCNTAILDGELMAAVKPKFVVFADPIFHFGPSRFAARFRALMPWFRWATDPTPTSAGPVWSRTPAARNARHRELVTFQRRLTRGIDSSPWSSPGLVESCCWIPCHST